MSSSSQSTSQSYASSSRVYMCKCRKPYPLTISWTEENLGRRFFNCINYQRGGCNFFRWVDPPMCKRSRDIIQGMHHICQHYKAVNIRLRNDVEQRDVVIAGLEREAGMRESRVIRLTTEGVICTFFENTMG